MSNKDPEKQREYNRRYCAEHLKTERERQHKYRAEHPEKSGERQRKYREANPERACERLRESHLRCKYGIAPKEFDALATAQDGRCAIYGCGDRRRLCVDHDHATNTIRGLLCDGCNKAIGFMQDKPDLLQKAIDYLRRSK